MTESDINSGERAEHERRRRKLTLFICLGIAGLVSGAYVGYSSEGNIEKLFGPDAVISPVLAVILALGYFTLVGAGSFMLTRQTDEVERLGTYKTAALAAAMFMLVYPVWFFLWKGGLVPEPMHGILYLLFLLTSIVGSIFYRAR